MPMNSSTGFETVRGCSRFRTSRWRFGCLLTTDCVLCSSALVQEKRTIIHVQAVLSFQQPTTFQRITHTSSHCVFETCSHWFVSSHNLKWRLLNWLSDHPMNYVCKLGCVSTLKCIYIYIYMYIYTCVYMYTCVCIYIYIYIHEHSRACKRSYLSMAWYTLCQHPLRLAECLFGPLDDVQLQSCASEGIQPISVLRFWVSEGLTQAQS